ncbi:MAG: SUMF1/EgtB/PvdO family nonheme iron enzyme [Syntrophales bacterium]
MVKFLKIISSRLYIRWWAACVMMALLTLIVMPVHAQSFPRTPGRAESLTQPVRRGADLSPLKQRRAGGSPTPSAVSIPSLSREKRAAETAIAPSPGTPHKVGSGRDVPQLGSAPETAAHLQWQKTPQAGMITAISITSPEAVGIRLGILVRRMPAEATLRFYSQGAETAYEISGSEVMESIKRNLEAGDGGDAARTYWSPHIEGEEATIEIELPPGLSPETVEISIPQISHFFSSPLAAQGGNVIMSIGDAESCEIDATCYSDWSPEGNATAKMSFVDGGSSYVCSGTLLNDTASTGIPYFLSANHCISKQTVASTLQTYWFYRSTSCNSGALNPGNKTLTGGATLLYPSSLTDTSFMKLNSSPPTGAMYAGWDSNAPVLVTPVTGVHHPSGDLQKISYGSIQAFKDCTIADPISHTFTCSAATQTNAEYINVTYTSGIVEGGSSGSGLFKTSGSSHYLIGQLRGGSSSCINPDGSNIYGRFDLAYNAALHQWLNAGSTFALSISKPGNGSGTVASAPSGINCGTTCSAPFAGGASVTLTATPASGSTFSGWSGACSGTGTTCSLVMNTDNSVTATFTIATIALGVALDNTSLVWTTGGNAPFVGQMTTSYSGGSAAQTGKIGNSQSTYLSTSVTGPGTLSFYWKVSSELNHDFFAVYLDGVVKYSWSGSTSWYKSVLTIPAGTHTVKWEYVKDSTLSSGQDAGWVDNVVFTPTAAYLLTASKTGSGTITSSPAGISCGSDCTENYYSGTAVTLTATPDAGWYFTGWGDACSGAGSCTITMSAAQSVSATFAPTFNLTVSKTGNGTITSNPAGISCGTDCTEIYKSGTSVTLTATPDSGWNFTVWGGACSGTGSCQITMNQANNVTATFKEQFMEVGYLNLADAILSLQVVSGITPAQAVNKFIDVNGDGKIGLAEALYILQVVAGVRTNAYSNFYVSGAITVDGAGLSNVAVTLSGAASATTTTDANGNYTFIGLQKGNYKITPSKADYTFTAQPVNVIGGNAVQNMTGVRLPPADMVLIPAGSFNMGDAVDGYSKEIPVHTVTLSAFYLDKYEVTKALWDEVKTWATAKGYTFDNAGAGTAATHPVQTVSRYDVVKWLNARSERDGRTPVYHTDSGQATVYRTGQVNVVAGAVKWSANGYRLPTEAEWEYAARAGTTTRFYTGDCISSDTQANYIGTRAYYGCPAGQYRAGTTVVGSFPANPWGLYDMAGNVWEWTWDWYGSYASTAVTNPQGPASGSLRVVRGGSWGDIASFLRSAGRDYGTPSLTNFNLGFRSALSQP